MFLGTLTCTVGPLLVSIKVWCQSTPWSIVLSSCTTVITTAFVDERQRAAVS